jgi:hypothetical protein
MSWKLDAGMRIRRKRLRELKRREKRNYTEMEMNRERNMTDRKLLEKKKGKDS